MPHREHSPFHIIIGFRKLSGLHHAAHATHSGSTHRHIGFFFLLVADDTFGSQEHTGNRSGILQSHTSHLGRVDDTAGFHVLVFVLTGIVTEVAFSLAVLSLQPPNLPNLHSPQSDEEALRWHVLRY